MTKKELLATYEELLREKGMGGIDGIGANSNKERIENAINCLTCSDEALKDYLTVVKLKYKNIYDTVLGVGNYETHYYNRLYIYNLAREILDIN